MPPPERDASISENAKQAQGKDPLAGLSQFLGKVLDQLSLSSWLPAATLVANVAVLIQLNAQGSTSVAAAIQALTSKPLGILIVLLFAIVIATVVTQAFEFETIRLLEGYADFGRGPLHAAMAARIRRHKNRLKRLRARYRAALVSAFNEARGAMVDLGKDQRVLDVIERDVRGLPQIHRRKVVEHALRIEWYDYLTADTRYRLDALEARISRFPEPNRILPTRLGNTLRAAEDELPIGPDEDVVGFVMRHLDELPEAIKEEHEDYRTRLDMYCTLVLVFVAISAVAFLSLREIAGPIMLGAIVSAYWFLAWVSYEAAITSARGYGDVLREAAHVVEEVGEREEKRLPTSRIRTFLHFDSVRRALRREP